VTDQRSLKNILSSNVTKNQSTAASEALGVYIHIPYCLQRCTYCDFATYVHTEILEPKKYIDLVIKEISLRKNLYPPQFLKTVYFGGGTPSLIPAKYLQALIVALNQNGFQTTHDTEITIEINPATVDQKKLETYLSFGVNRFSVGAQSFSDRLLKMVHREHNARQTMETLLLLESYNLNYSFDLLFALPTQTLEELEYDLKMISSLKMKHISPYCLTVPEGHPLSKNRPLDTEQLEMFALIDTYLTERRFVQYEISNYALPGFESKHNLLYWTDVDYWGLGLSAHSYSKKTGWGTRFWNSPNIKVYENQIHSLNTALNDENSEALLFHQSLSDYCHTSLRLKKGLSLRNLEQKFNLIAVNKIKKICSPLIDQGLLSFKNDHFTLTKNGIYISNQIFEKLTFLSTDF
jgi:oxygen-independent coproporphyrinogen III oxidase